MEKKSIFILSIDFGVDELEELCDQCKFPWLLSNVYDRDTEKILANAKTTYVLEKNGRKFGLIGLVEEEWLATLPTVDVDDVDFLDFVEEGRLLAQKLKNEVIFRIVHFFDTFQMKIDGFSE